MRTTMQQIKVILASGSPRRKELLEKMGLEFEIRKSDKEEIVTSENPEEVVKELALQKAEDVAEQLQDDTEQDILLIGADTVVARQDRIMGKPENPEMAYEMIESLQGDTHMVYTGVALLIRQSGSWRTRNFAVGTKVEVASMTKKEIEDYIATGEPMDKAGAYAIQGQFSVFVKGIEGDYNNVVGFPVAEVYRILQEEGLGV